MIRLPRLDYEAPDSVAGASALLRERGGRAALLGGGTDLLPALKRGQSQVDLLIGLGRIPGLDGLDAPGSLQIGARVTLATLARDLRVRRGWSALAQAAESIAAPAIRNAATVGGNLCLDTRCDRLNQPQTWCADPCLKRGGAACQVVPGPRCFAANSSDLAPVLIALRGAVVLQGGGGERTIAAEALYGEDGIAWLTRRPDELLTRVVVPPQDGWAVAVRKVRLRDALDFSVLSVAVAVQRDGGGAVTDARIVLGAVASRPLLCVEAAQALVGAPLSDERIEQAARFADRQARPLDQMGLDYYWRKKILRGEVARTLAGVG